MSKEDRMYLNAAPSDIEEVEKKSFFHHTRPGYRFSFLVVCCLLTFGSYWCYDLPSALQQPLEDKLGFTDDTKYSLFYSVYNFINIPMVLFGGMFIDKIGLRSGAILFATLTFLGQILFSVGVMFEDPDVSFWVMLAGRAVFSLGGESIAVAQNTYCSKWFASNELALAFGITLSFSRLGSVVNMDLTPSLAKSFGIPFSIWFGTGICFLSVVMTVIAAIYDKNRDKHYPPVEVKAGQEFSIRDIKNFPARLWLLFIICVAFYSAVFPFVSIVGNPVIQRKWDYTQEQSSQALSVAYFIPIGLSPFFGAFSDWFGKKPLLNMIASTIMVGVYILLAFTYLNPIAPMVIFGIAYTLCASALWPCVPYVCQSHMLGTAYGVMNAVQNGGLAVVQLVAGILTPKKTEPLQLNALYFLGSFPILAAVVAFILMTVDLKGDRILSHSSKERAAFEATPVEVDEETALIKS